MRENVSLQRASRLHTDDSSSDDEVLRSHTVIASSWYKNANSLLRRSGNLKYNKKRTIKIVWWVWAYLLLYRWSETDSLRKLLITSSPPTWWPCTSTFPNITPWYLALVNNISYSRTVYDAYIDRTIILSECKVEMKGRSEAGAFASRVQRPSRFCKHIFLWNGSFDGKW